jgi:hypothetical protein
VTALSALKRQTAGRHRQMMVFGPDGRRGLLTLVGVFVDDRTLLGAPIWLTSTRLSPRCGPTP